jgi:hypothetical protein
MALKTASINHIVVDHPFTNPYCDYKLFKTTGKWNNNKLK